MIQFGVARFQLYSQAMDMRKGINSLIAVVQRDLGRDACAGDAFVFINKSRKLLKLLMAHQSGFWLCQHRLARGTFQQRLARKSDGGPVAIELSLVEWEALLAGMVVEKSRQLPRFGGDNNDL